MLSKILKTTALIALEVLLDDPSEDAKKNKTGLLMNIMTAQEM